MQNPPEKILIIRFSSLGDIILVTPLFRETKRIFPDAQIDFLTAKEFGGICENNPHIRKQLLLDRKNSTESFHKILEIVKEEDYDLVLDAHRSLRSRALLWKWFGFFTSSFSDKIKNIDKRSWKRNLLLMRGFKLNLLKENYPSQRGAYLDLLSDFDSGKKDASTELFPSEEQVLKIQSLLDQHNPHGRELIAFGPSASFPGKCWPKERFLELGQKLKEDGYQIVLMGGPGDQEAKWLEEESKGEFINLAGTLNFLETAAFLKQCRLAVSNDSAVVHFAEAMKTPAVSIFGPTAAEFGYGPFLEKSSLMAADLKCRPCSRNGKGSCHNPVKRECFLLIEVDQVYQQAVETLKNETELTKKCHH